MRVGRTRKACVEMSGRGSWMVRWREEVDRVREMWRAVRVMLVEGVDAIAVGGVGGAKWIYSHFFFSLIGVRKTMILETVEKAEKLFFDEFLYFLFLNRRASPSLSCITSDAIAYNVIFLLVCNRISSLRA